MKSAKLSNPQPIQNQTLPELSGANNNNESHLLCWRDGAWKVIVDYAEIKVGDIVMLYNAEYGSYVTDMEGFAPSRVVQNNFDEQTQHYDTQLGRILMPSAKVH